MKADLSLATNEELIDELRKRFDHFVFNGLRKTTQYSGDQENIHWIQYDGQYHMLLGLASAISMDIFKDHPADKVTK